MQAMGKKHQPWAQVHQPWPHQRQCWGPECHKLRQLQLWRELLLLWRERTSRQLLRQEQWRARLGLVLGLLPIPGLGFGQVGEGAIRDWEICVETS